MHNSNIKPSCAFAASNIDSSLSTLLPPILAVGGGVRLDGAGQLLGGPQPFLLLLVLSNPRFR